MIHSPSWMPPHICLVDDLAAAGEPLAGGAVHHGRLHLPEVGRHDPDTTMNSVAFSPEARPRAAGEASST